MVWLDPDNQRESERNKHAESAGLFGLPQYRLWIVCSINELLEILFRLYTTILGWVWHMKQMVSMKMRLNYAKKQLI